MGVGKGGRGGGGGRGSWRAGLGLNKGARTKPGGGGAEVHMGDGRRVSEKGKRICGECSEGVQCGKGAAEIARYTRGLCLSMKVKTGPPGH